MLTHCFAPGYTGECDKWTYECKLCNRKGLDCLKSCSDCRFLSFRERKRSLAEFGNLKLLKILCKECSLFHIMHSVKALLFNMKVFQDDTFVDYTSKSIIGKKYISEVEKEPFLRDTGLTYTDVLRCTSCRIKFARKNCCIDCDDLNQINIVEKKRLALINGHLTILDYLCKYHSSFYYYNLDF